MPKNALTINALLNKLGTHLDKQTITRLNTLQNKTGKELINTIKKLNDIPQEDITILNIEMREIEQSDNVQNKYGLLPKTEPRSIPAPVWDYYREINYHLMKHGKKQQLPLEQKKPIITEKYTLSQKREVDIYLAETSQHTQQPYFNDVKVVALEDSPNGYTTRDIKINIIIKEKIDIGQIPFAEYYQTKNEYGEKAGKIYYFWERKPQKKQPLLTSNRQLYEVVGTNNGKTIFLYLPETLEKPCTIRAYGYNVQLADRTSLGKGRNASTNYPAFIAEKYEVVQTNNYATKEEKQVDAIWQLAQKLKKVPPEHIEEYLWQSITHPFIHAPYPQDKKLFLCFFVGPNDKTLGGDYPIHLAYIGLPGAGRTRRLICLANIMDDIILTAGTSTGLLPNYGSELPNPGAIISRSGDYFPIVSIDELWKSVGSSNIERRSAGFGKITNILTGEFFEAPSGKGTQKLQNKTRVIFGDNMKKGMQEHIMDGIIDRYPLEFIDRLLIIPQNKAWIDYIEDKKDEIGEEMKQGLKKVEIGEETQHFSKNGENSEETQHFSKNRNTAGPVHIPNTQKPENGGKETLKGGEIGEETQHSSKTSYGGGPVEVHWPTAVCGKKIRILNKEDLQILFYFCGSGLSIKYPDKETELYKMYKTKYKELRQANPTMNNWQYSRIYEHFTHLIEACTKIRKLKELCKTGFEEYIKGEGLLEVIFSEKDLDEAEDILYWLIELWEHNSSNMGSQLLVTEITEEKCSICGIYTTTGKTREGLAICRKCARKKEKSG